MADNGIKFLRGEVANLPATSVPGAFYLTTDECRLYYGTGTGAPVLLNEQINIIASVDVLPTVSAEHKLANGKNAVGVIYYASKENILCIYGQKQDNKWGWIQINPDTNTDTSIASISISEPQQETDGEGKKSYKYTLSVYEKVDGKTQETPFTTTFTIDSSMVSELATEVNIGVQSELTTIDQTDVAVVSLTGAGANSDDKTALVAGDKIAFATETVTVDGKPVEAIKISSTDTTYTLEQDETKVKLTGGGKTQSVEFKAGNKLDVTADANGGILYSHETIGSAATYGSTDVTGTTNAQVINIPVITTDGYGHIASAQTAPLTINNTTITGATIGVDETDASKLTVSVTDNNGQRIPATSEGVLYHTITVTDLDADGEEVETTNTIKNQGNLGSFYSKAVIDKKLQGIDAFTYKGTFTGNLPVAGKQYHVGDVYVSKEDQNVELNNISVTLHAGDLVYVTGTETNGIITENLKFEVVHSENNTDTTYDLIAENDKITLTDGAAKDDINVTDDDIVILKATGGALQASHKTYSTAAMADGITQPTGALIDGGTFSAASVDADKYGHVTSIEKIDYTLPSYALAQANEKLQLKSGGRVLGSVTPAGDDKISATFSGADENVTLTINHLGSQATKGTSTPAALTFGGTFVAVSGLVDEKGHVKEYTETTYTLPSLPADPVYTFNDFVITDNQTLENHGTGLSLASYILKDGERTGTLDFGLYSDTLAVTKVDANNVAVELVWGTF